MHKSDGALLSANQVVGPRPLDPIFLDTLQSVAQVFNDIHNTVCFQAQGLDESLGESGIILQAAWSAWA